MSCLYDLFLVSGDFIMKFCYCVFVLYSPYILGATCTIHFLFFFFFRAAPMAYGSSRAKCPATAAGHGHSHSHSNTGSKPFLQPTSQLTAMLDPRPTEQAQGSNRILMDTRQCHKRNSLYHSLSKAFVQ